VIETVLIFLAGMLTAGLGALLLMPAINSRAVRLYRRRLDQQLPRSVAEMAAAKDAIRAEMAARMARVEVELDAARQAVATAQLQSSEDRQLARALEAEKVSFEATIADYEKRLDEAHSIARYAHEAVARVDAERRDLQRQVSVRAMEAETSRDEAESLAADMKMALVEAEARIAVLSETIADLTHTPPLIHPPTVSSGPAAPVIHVDFGAKTERQPERQSAKGGEDDVDDEARIDDLANRLKLLRARNAVARQRIESALAKGTEPSGDAPKSGSS
jgi:chromosome segregation ATPase